MVSVPRSIYSLYVIFRLGHIVHLPLDLDSLDWPPLPLGLLLVYLHGLVVLVSYGFNKIRNNVIDVIRGTTLAPGLDSLYGGRP